MKPAQILAVALLLAAAPAAAQRQVPQGRVLPDSATARLLTERAKQDAVGGLNPNDVKDVRAVVQTTRGDTASVATFVQIRNGAYTYGRELYVRDREAPDGWRRLLVGRAHVQRWHIQDWVAKPR